MTEKQLFLHRGSHRITRDELLWQVPDPQPLGPRHKPIPHRTLVYQLTQALTEAGYTITREEFAVGNQAQLLFGVMGLLRNSEQGLPRGTGLSIGFRHSTNQLLAPKIVAGSRVFVCDNLSLSGEEFILHHKSTTGFDLPWALREAMQIFAVQTKRLAVDIQRLQTEYRSDLGAKSIIYDLFANDILPPRLFDKVHNNYFHPDETATDCQPRSLWGIHNAATRAIKTLKPASQFTRTLNLGKAFGLGQLPAGAQR